MNYSPTALDFEDHVCPLCERPTVHGYCPHCEYPDFPDPNPNVHADVQAMIGALQILIEKLESSGATNRFDAIRILGAFHEKVIADAAFALSAYYDRVES